MISLHMKHFYEKLQVRPESEAVPNALRNRIVTSRSYLFE
jgi:hypothetical protein